MATKNSEITLPKTIIDEKAADEKSVISSPAPVIKAASKKVAATKIVVKKSAVKKATPKKVAPKKVAVKKVAVKKVAPKKVASKKAASNPVVAKEMSNLPAVFSTAGFDPSLAGIDFTDLTATFEKQYAAAFKLGTAMGAGADLLSKTYADYAQRSFETGLSASQAFLSDGDVTKLATVQTALVEEGFVLSKSSIEEAIKPLADFVTESMNEAL
ncbi:MAG: phasin family protein [Rhodospirillaceae bacterium]|nr:phasin family protein [Rhodospirillaceae bacterium]MBT5752168.1 phasin family protein [Rhodospirillaceae bacterium]